MSTRIEARPPVVEHRRPLTHILDLGEKGLAMEATELRPLTCKHCRGEVIRQSTIGRPPDYCTRRCQLDYATLQRQAGRPIRICIQCSNDVPVTRGNRAKFCSDRCRLRAQSLRQGRVPVESQEVRLWSRVGSPDSRGCWSWAGGRMASGYGTITTDQNHFVVHRLVWETYIGPIPAGYQVDHICRNRACVNTEHLEPVTQLENLRRERVAKALEPDVLAAMTVAEFAAIIGAQCGVKIVRPL